MTSSLESLTLFFLASWKCWHVWSCMMLLTGVDRSNL
jgi:hypothetical protein